MATKTTKKTPAVKAKRVRETHAEEMIEIEEAKEKKGNTDLFVLKQQLKVGEKWLKHLTKGEGAKLHLLYTAIKGGKEVTLCTEVDCEKNKQQ